MSHHYHLLYRFHETRDGKVNITVEPHPEGLTVEQVKARSAKEGVGAADAVIVFSLLYPADGSFSMQFYSVDGRTHDDLSDDAVFWVWAMTAFRLMRSPTLSEGKRALAMVTHEALQGAIQGNRKATEIVTFWDEAAGLISGLVSKLAEARAQKDQVAVALIDRAEAWLASRARIVPR
jgi:hypothetical protein